MLMLSPDYIKLEPRRARELGLAACLMKPVRRRDLFEAIATAISRHAAHADAGIMQPSLPAALRVAPDTQSDLSPLNILLVDDSMDNRILVHAYLKNTSHQVDDAENGAVAVARLKDGNYDLVLMDIHMPVMDGFETTRAIRDWERDRGLPRTPLLVLSASALDEDVRRSLEAGADRHVSKPINKTILMSAIREIHASALRSRDQRTRMTPLS
jgi:two-component system sensor histidine kinase/response regulator